MFSAGILLLLILPVLWFFFAKYILHAEVGVKEVSAALAVTVAFGVAGQYTGYKAQVHDTEIWNSRVAKKYRATVSCSHSYQCNCVTTTDAKGNSTTSCQTCYEHDHDYDWIVEGTQGDVIKIDRVDSQGVEMPARFADVKIEEPMAVQHSYDNYIKAVPESLFNVSKGDYKKYLPMVPDYPGEIYDYYRSDRVLFAGVPAQNPRAWSEELSKALRVLGPQRQANAVILFSNNADAEYAYAVRNKWNGGKKNDVIVVVGCPEYPKIAWVKVFALSNKSIFQVQLEQDLMQAGDAVTRSPSAFMEILSKNVMQNFDRKPMKSFEYLKAQIRMPIWAMVITAILSLLSGVVATGIVNDWNMAGPFRLNSFRRNSFGYNNTRYRR